MAVHKLNKDKFLSGDEAEELFSTLDETGHPNVDVAREQHERRAHKQTPREIDPLSNEDPSGATTDRTIRRTAVAFVLITLVVIMLAQTSCGVIRRVSTAHLSKEVSVTSVSRSLQNGIEWGNGYTSFPDEFSVEQADENSGIVEVSVVDVSSANAAECFSSSQVQASALSINALLNPNIHAVIYHVKVRTDEQGNFLHNTMFGFLRPVGTLRSFMTFVWTKNTSEQGVNFTCRITGLDEQTTAGIRKKLQANLVLSDILAPPGTRAKDGASPQQAPSDKTNASNTDSANGSNTSSSSTSNSTSSSTSNSGVAKSSNSASAESSSSKKTN